MDIVSSTDKHVDALVKLELPAGDSPSPRIDQPHVRVRSRLCCAALDDALRAQHRAFCNASSVMQ